MYLTANSSINISDDNVIGPDANISLDIGIIGVSLFSFLSIVTCYASIIARNKNSKYMFLFACIFSVFDLPRYVALIIQKAYINQITYSFHMIAGIFYFISLSFACYLLHDAVDISGSTSSPLKSLANEKKFLIEQVLFDHKTLIISNVIYDLIVIVAVVMCINSKSLDLFFEDSIIYEIYTYYEAVIIVMYTLCLLYFGFILRSRILSIHKDIRSHKDLIQIRKINKSLRRLMGVMIICFLSFTVRIGMLIIKVWF